MKQYFIVILSCLATTAFGFIPPLTAVVHDLFDYRHPGLAQEIVFRHHVDLRAGETVDLEERIVAERGQTLCIWRQLGQPPFLVARWDGQGYLTGKGERIPSRSAIFMKYFTLDNPDAFRDALILEQFTRRDQWYEYKPGFMPDGDPQTWNVKENYLRHDDIYLSRLAQGVAITVQGSDDPNNQKAVYFDKSLHGLDRIEWRSNNVATAWNFDQFTRRQGEGFFPSKATFESGGLVLISSEVQSVRHLKDKQLFEFKNSWKAASRAPAPTGTAATALKTLLSYR